MREGLWRQRVLRGDGALRIGEWVVGDRPAAYDYSGVGKPGRPRGALEPVAVEERARESRSYRSCHPGTVIRWGKPTRSRVLALSGGSASSARERARCRATLPDGPVLPRASPSTYRLATPA